MKEMLWVKKQNDFKVPLREPQGDADTPEALEAERQAEQERVDNGKYSCHS